MANTKPVDPSKTPKSLGLRRTRPAGFVDGLKARLRQRNDAAFVFDGNPFKPSRLKHKQNFNLVFELRSETTLPIRHWTMAFESSNLESDQRMGQRSMKLLKFTSAMWISARISTIVAPVVALTLVLGVASGCVSVNLGPKSAEKSRGVNYTTPSKPFASISETRADGAWINKTNGNSISFLSSCNDPADPSIEFASRELLAGLSDVNSIKSETVSYNSREALVSEVEGKLEGVLTRISSVVFKKNGCLYSITYIGVPKNFESDRGRFDNFLRGFQAP